MGPSVALKQSFSKLLRAVQCQVVRRQVCQQLCNGRLEIPGFESHWLAEILTFLGWCLTSETVWGRKVKTDFSRLKFNRKAESCRKPSREAPFFTECRKALRNLAGSSDLSQSSEELYREYVVGSASDPLGERFGRSLDKIRSQWNWAPGSDFLNNRVLADLAARSERVAHQLGFQSRLCRHARLYSLRQESRRNGFARLLLLQTGPLILESQGEVDGPHWSPTASAVRRWLRHRQCWSSVERWETGGIFRDQSCGPNGDLRDVK